jgi:hypothetical protein
VSEFIDITGVSGSVYRFRRITGPAQLPAMAGNFLFSRRDGDRNEMICCGEVPSLMRAAEAWPSAVEQHQAEAIFVRLNVSRSVRVAEHMDIIAGHNPRIVVAEAA